MRTVTCMAAAGLLIAAMGFGGDDNRAAQKPALQAKHAPRPTVTGAPSAKKSPAPVVKDKPGTDEKRRALADKPDTPDKYAADRAAILESAVKFMAAYSEHDAGAIAGTFAPDGEYIDEKGTLFRGRDEIEAYLKSFFEAHPATALQMHIESLRFLTPTVAIEDGSSTCAITEGGPQHSSRYTAVHVKADGEWFVASSREYAASGEPGHATQLAQLNWLLGKWIDQDDDAVVHFDCTYSDDGNYLLREFTISAGGEKVITGTQRMAWDAASKSLRSWTFDSDGGHFEGTWHRDNDNWYLTSSGITSEGRQASGTAIYTSINSHTMTWQLVNREIGGVHVPDSDVFTLVLRGPAPEKWQNDSEK